MNVTSSAARFRFRRNGSTTARFDGRSTVRSPTTSECHAPQSQAYHPGAFDAGGRLGQLALERFPTELAICQDRTAGFLLQGDDFAHGVVLDCFEVVPARCRRCLWPLSPPTADAAGEGSRRALREPRFPPDQGSAGNTTRSTPAGGLIGVCPQLVPHNPPLGIG